MSSRWRSALTVLLPSVVLVTGCASRVALYSGRTLPESMVALIPYDDARREILVTSVDSHRIGSSRAEIEILPGPHVIELEYTPKKAVSSYPVRIPIHAEAGHRYVLSAKMLQGQVDGEGVWGGKYQAYVYDLNTAREVGRSTGPAPKSETGD